MADANGLRTHVQGLLVRQSYYNQLVNTLANN